MKKTTWVVSSVFTLIVSTAGSVFAQVAPPVITPVPEPGTFVLLGIGAVGIVLYKKLKK